MGNDPSKLTASAMKEGFREYIPRSIGKYQEKAQKNNETEDFQNCDQASKPLDPHQVQVIRSSWEVLGNEIDHVGMLAFLHLFDHFPDAKNSFKHFKSLDKAELKDSEIFHNHAARVTAVIKKVVSIIDQPDKYVPYLRILGQKHLMYDAETKLFDQMGYMFLAGIKPVLEKENAWNDEVMAAWEAVLTLIIAEMKAPMMITYNGS